MRWVGLIDHYREYLPVSAKTPVITLYEGNTPLIPAEFLNKIKGNASKGILLVEGAATTTFPLVLELWKDGQKICERNLPLSISGVDETTGQTMLSRHIYEHHKIRWGHRHVDLLHTDADGKSHMDYSRIHDTEAEPGVGI